MTYKGLVLGVSALVTMGLAGCGSLVHGGTQTVDVDVRGSARAYCEFYTSKYRNAGHFPNKVTLERSRENLTAECRGEENRSLKFEIPSTMNAAGTGGNVATGVVPGVAADAVTGGVWSYPDPIIVDFRTVGENDANPWPAEETAAGRDRAAFFESVKSDTAAAAHVAPKVGMQPVLDVNPAVSARETAKPAVIDTAPAPAIAPQAGKAAPAGGVAEPIISPEDHMGMHPAKVKAEAEAKRKAAIEAKERKAAEAAAERARAASEKAEADARKAAEEAARKAQEEAAKAAAAASQAADSAAEAVESIETLEAAPAPADAAPDAAPAPETNAAPAASEPTIPAPFEAETPAATQEDAAPRADDDTSGTDAGAPASF